MATQYCQPSDLLSVINGNALQGISQTQQTSACVQASSIADDYLNSRYPLPLLQPYPMSLVIHTAYIAVFLLLNARGFNPEKESDRLILDNYDRAVWDGLDPAKELGYFPRIRNQKLNPAFNVTAPSPTTNFQLPSVATGGPSAAPIRGWTRPANGLPTGITGGRF